MKKKIVNLPFWKEYPERDTEFVRVYPNIHGPITEEEVWEKEEMGFYVHIPYCKNVCISCPYKKLEPRKDSIQRYLNAIKTEISLYAAKFYVQDHKFTIGYFGGGTPTSLEADQMVDILQHMHKELNLVEGMEITSETTPVDITEEKADKLMENGINRFSIGIQSFQDDELKYIGRNYTSKRAIQTIKLLQSKGVNLNVDLMYGLPGQTMERWDENLQIAIDLGLTSISFYRYILIDNPKSTIRVIRDKIPPLPPDKVKDDQFFHACEKLVNAGFEGYFADEFSKPGYRNGYTTGPWEKCLDFLGLGPCATGNVKEHWFLNEPNADKYIEKLEAGQLPIVMGSKITREDELRRRMILGVKVCKVDRKSYIEKTGIDFVKLFPDEIQQLEEWGLVKLTDEALEVLGPKGWYYLDNISKQFYAEKYKRLPQPINSDISHWLNKELVMVV